jgi:hypothetical protein
MRPPDKYELARQISQTFTGSPPLDIWLEVLEPLHVSQAQAAPQ